MALFAFIIRVVVTGILTIIAAIAPAQMSDAMAPNAPLDADNCKLNFAVMSDTHIRTDELGFLNNLVLNLTMNDFEYSEGRYDGIVFVLRADVDAVQTHNAEDAIMSAWGVDVSISDDGSLSLN